jgi:rhodanese-related sulfurtransferase
MAGSNLAGSNTAQALATGSIPFPDVPRIALQEAKDKLDGGQAVLVDVRSKQSYDRSHAAGAISIPETEIDARMDEFPADKELVLY